METAIKKPRLEWLDALRGFTMIMVVANHVATMGFEQTWRDSSSLKFLLLFRMPLFFFVSGFLAYKATQQWDLKQLGALIGKKLRVQIIPTVFFFCVGAAMLFPDFWQHCVHAFHSPMKGGYWFTLVLLYMFIVYYLFAYLESKLKWRSWVPITLLFIVSLLAYETCYLPRYFSWAQGYRGEPCQFMFDTSFIELFRYFPFFLYGNIVHRYWPRAQRLMDSQWFYPVVIFIAILSTLDAIKWHTLRMTWAVVPLTLARFSLLTIVFMYFRHYQQYFTKLSPIGISLQYIGRRTLDIYLIHYFFMPHLPTIGQFFHNYRGNFAIDVTVAVFISLIIVGFSIITSNILRVSPFFKKWLFGRG